MPYSVVDYEISLMKDLGVKIVNGKALNATSGLSIKSLQQEGYECFFVGIGLPNPNKDPVFKGLTEENGFYTSKNFLPLVSKASKPGKLSCFYK